MGTEKWHMQNHFEAAFLMFVVRSIGIPAIAKSAMKVSRSITEMPMVENIAKGAKLWDDKLFSTNVL